MVPGVKAGGGGCDSLVALGVGVAAGALRRSSSSAWSGSALLRIATVDAERAWDDALYKFGGECVGVSLTELGIGWMEFFSVVVSSGWFSSSPQIASRSRLSCGGECGVDGVSVFVLIVQFGFVV